MYIVSKLKKEDVGRVSELCMRTIIKEVSEISANTDDQLVFTAMIIEHMHKTIGEVLAEQKVKVKV